MVEPVVGHVIEPLLYGHSTGPPCFRFSATAGAFNWWRPLRRCPRRGLLAGAQDAAVTWVATETIQRMMSPSGYIALKFKEKEYEQRRQLQHRIGPLWRRKECARDL
jgi:hypothetical protein